MDDDEEEVAVVEAAELVEEAPALVVRILSHLRHYVNLFM